VWSLINGAADLAAQYPVLAALTHKLEVVWYGYGSAAESDFEEALGQLEKLGCR